ncbi:MAG: hypothetical protein GDYSWBUE_001239 [Candidatus Fervidibacterota bacterium]
MPRKSSGSVKVFSPRYSREEVISLLRERLPKLNDKLPLRWVVLFGSYARGDYTAFSDIDLLVVYADPPRQNAFSTVVKTLSLFNLQPHVMSVSEFSEVSSVWERMLRDSIVLFGNRP